MKRHDPTRPRQLILIVDDCVEQRDLYELALESDFDILTAGRGPEAIALASAKTPDAIVLDLRMPGMDGLEVCRHLKSDMVTAGIPVIILTAADDHGIHTDALIAGAAALLTKPCSPLKLLGTIRAAVDRSVAAPRFR
jgi:CheY-like chemotaxis protein